jgi:hypothetical protein
LLELKEGERLGVLTENWEGKRKKSNPRIVDKCRRPFTSLASALVGGSGRLDERMERKRGERKGK